MLKGKADIQMYQSRLEEWASRNLRKFSMHTSPRCLWRGHQGGRARIFTAQSGEVRDSEYKQKQLRLDIRRNFFPMRTVRQCHRVVREDVHSLALDVFKT